MKTKALMIISVTLGISIPAFAADIYPEGYFSNRYEKQTVWALESLKGLDKNIDGSSMKLVVTDVFYTRNAETLIRYEGQTLTLASCGKARFLDPETSGQLRIPVPTQQCLEPTTPSKDVELTRKKMSEVLSEFDADEIKPKIHVDKNRLALIANNSEMLALFKLEASE